MAATVKTAIDPQTGEFLRCVFDLQTCLPVEPIQRYLNYCNKRGLATNTITTYAYRLVDFWVWLEYNVTDWMDIGLDDLGDFAKWYLLGNDVEVFSEGLQESKRSPKTVNQAITVIQSFYEFHAVEGRVDEKQFTRLGYRIGKQSGFLRGIVKSDPEPRKRIKLKEARFLPGCLTDEKVVQLVEACLPCRDKLMLMLLRETGVRRGELLGLHLEDVRDVDSTGRICIVRRINPNGAWAKGKERVIPILHNRKSVQEMLRAYLLDEFPCQAEKLGHGMLFVNLQGKHVGQPVSLARFNKLFQQLHNRTGITAHPHLFRHTFATRMLQMGYLDEYVQQLLGHRSISTTKDIYSHVLDELSLDVIMGEE
jgi:integrase/recombinase XerD